MDREVRYHRRHDFDRAAWLYLASFILGMFALIWRNKVFYFVAALPGVVGLAWNVYGLAERTALSERALIGNLYETLLYLGAVAFALALVCEWFTRSRWFLTIGSLLATGFLWIAQDRALLMNPSISTLQPVLDNNFWIHIHVPVIVASYAPLMLAALMGNVYLLLSIFGGRRVAGAEGDRADPVLGDDPGRHPPVRGAHPRRHLGGPVLGPVLGMGPEGDLGVHHVGRVHRADPRPLVGLAARLRDRRRHDHRRRLARDDLLGRELPASGPPLVRVGQRRQRGASPGGSAFPAWVISYAAFEVVLIVAAAFFRKPAEAAPVAASDEIRRPEPAGARELGSTG